MPSTRNAFWLAVLCLVLGAWGWDRGRLSERIQVLTLEPQPTVEDYAAPVGSPTYRMYPSTGLGSLELGGYVGSAEEISK